jgi:hypothetical protein
MDLKLKLLAAAMLLMSLMTEALAIVVVKR